VASRFNLKQLRHVQEKSDLPENVSLRSFREGRYEDVVHQFDVKRALKRGVKIPTPKRMKNALRSKGSLSAAHIAALASQYHLKNNQPHRHTT